MCPHCGASRENVVGHQVSRVYDGVLFWSCFVCARAWSRDWTGYGRRQQIADEYVRQFNDAADEEAAHADR